jgi:hypothetical protein
MKPRTILISALLLAAAGSAFPLIWAARLRQLSLTADLALAVAVGGAAIVIPIVVAALQKPPMVLWPAGGARLLAAGTLGLLIVIASVALAFRVPPR